MKIIKAIFFLITISSFAQESNKGYRIKYELQYRSDSASQRFSQTENFVLLTNNKTSLFTSDQFYRRDSLNQIFQGRQSDQGMINLSKLPRTRFKFYVAKSVDSINFYEIKLNYKFHYLEQAMAGWVLGNKTKKIGAYNCYNATIAYGGRVWEAWYSPEIPLQDGPYKFINLPGLIIEVNDDRNNYRFNLTSIRKINSNELSFLNSFSSDKKEFKTITKQKYDEAMKTINENIFSELSKMGVSFDEENKKKVIQNRKSINNPIELK